MEINRMNYEAYFLDYFENSLPPEEVAELMVFLEANPDLNLEFESYEPAKLQPEVISLHGKSALKKKDYKEAGRINVYNYEEWMVSGIENDLSDQDTLELQDFLLINPDARLEYEIFKKTRLIPDDVRLRAKNDLKKMGFYAIYRTEIAVALAIAAMLLIFLAVYLTQDVQPYQHEISRSNSRPVIESNAVDTPDENKISEILGPPEYADDVNTPHETGPFTDNTRLHSGSGLNPMNSIDLIRVLPSPEESNFVFIQGRVIHSDAFKELIAPNQEEDHQPSFVLRFFKGSVSKILGGRTPMQKSLLEYTVSGYNLISDRDIEVEKLYDSSGKIVAYNIDGDLVKIGRKVAPPGTN